MRSEHTLMVLHKFFYWNKIISVKDSFQNVNEFCLKENYINLILKFNKSIEKNF